MEGPWRRQWSSTMSSSSSLLTEGLQSYRLSYLLQHGTVVLSHLLLLLWKKCVFFKLTSEVFLSSIGHINGIFCLLFLTGTQSRKESFGRFLISHRNLKIVVCSQKIVLCFWYIQIYNIFLHSTKKYVQCLKKKPYSKHRPLVFMIGKLVYDVWLFCGSRTPVFIETGYFLYFQLINLSLICISDPPWQEAQSLQLSPVWETLNSIMSFLFPFMRLRHI